MAQSTVPPQCMQTILLYSPEGLQKLLDIVSHYTSTWRYEINSSKSAVMVFGESTRSRTSGRQSRSFSVCSEIIQEIDSYKHLGVLRLVSTSGSLRISGRCSAGRSAFFALNSVGARFGCLHPITFHKLYSSLCLAIMLYGSELWSLPNKERSQQVGENSQETTSHNSRSAYQMSVTRPHQPYWLVGYLGTGGLQTALFH